MDWELSFLFINFNRVVAGKVLVARAGPVPGNNNMGCSNVHSQGRLLLERFVYAYASAIVAFFYCLLVNIRYFV